MRRSSTLRKLILERQFQRRANSGRPFGARWGQPDAILNALRRLSQEGVVEVFARRGFTSDATRSEMARLFTVREVLDGLAARLATARIRATRSTNSSRIPAARVPSTTPAAIRRYVELDAPSTAV